MSDLSVNGASHAPLIYEDEYYRRISALEERHWWYGGMRKVALALLKSRALRPRPRVLDAGCGTGGVMAWIADALEAGEVHGLDIAPAAIADAQRLGRDRLGSVSVGSVTEIPFPDARFDLVICNDVIQHLPTEGGDAEAFREMARVLAPGGALLVRSNSRLGMRHGAGDRDHDYQRYTLEEVAGLAEAAGLRLERATYANFVGGLHETFRRLTRAGRGGGGHHHHHAHDHAEAAQGQADVPSSPSRIVYEGYGVRDTARTNPLVNKLLAAAMSAEAALLRGRSARLPFGHTTFVLAFKPPA